MQLCDLRPEAGWTRCRDETAENNREFKITSTSSFLLPGAVQHFKWSHSVMDQSLDMLLMCMSHYLYLRHVPSCAESNSISNRFSLWRSLN